MTSMFTLDERESLRSELLERAAKDQRISGAAVTGSAAASREDRWSDIDLAFGVKDLGELSNVLSDWTTHMYDRHQALDHLDVTAGAGVFFVFLLPRTLQMDLAFVSPAGFPGFGAT